MWLFEDIELKRRLEAELKSWIGTPYRNNTCARDHGTDCCLFIAHSLKAVGILESISIPEYLSKDWHINGDREVFLESFRRNLTNLADGLTIAPVMDKPKFGDWAVLRLPRSKFCNHSILVLSEDSVIHSLVGTGVRVDTYSRLSKYEVHRWRLSHE